MSFWCLPSLTLRRGLLLSLAVALAQAGCWLRISQSSCTLRYAPVALCLPPSQKIICCDYIVWFEKTKREAN
ncbi:MAG: hypothetical protein BGO43_14180 [Gammaproteobacteria bacterium 39-13]|nr:MAG: hypothetical protein BGO43_14180 [Gammaproteobacteria bacterium 39-13]